MMRLLQGFLLLMGSLIVATTSQATVIEDFEDGNIVEYTAVGDVQAQATNAAAHDGNYGLQMNGHTGAEGWIYRNDGQVQLGQGDVISIWTRTMEVTDNFSRNYIGFGATPGGCLSVVVALNTQSLIIQNNAGYGYNNLAEVGYPILPGHWYRVEIHWAVGGQIDAYLYDSDGTTLLTQASANDNSIVSGGIAFRSFDAGRAAYFDTIDRNPGPVAVRESTWGEVKSLYR